MNYPTLCGFPRSLTRIIEYLGIEQLMLRILVGSPRTAVIHICVMPIWIYIYIYVDISMYICIYNIYIYIYT